MLCDMDGRWPVYMIYGSGRVLSVAVLCAEKGVEPAEGGGGVVEQAKVASW